MSDEISLAKGWTLEAYVAHNEAMRVKDAEIAAEHERFLTERDRRYSEVATEREKALAIKERADTDARILVAENQAYRDEKGNELRAQIERERGTYATRIDLAAVSDKTEAQLAPVIEYVAQQHGSPALTPGSLISLLGIVAILGGLYFGFKSLDNTQSTGTPTVVCTASYHPAPCP